MKYSISKSITRLLVAVTLAITSIYSVLILTYSWLIEDNIFNRQVQDEARFIHQSFSQTGKVEAPRSPFMTLHKAWSGLPNELKTTHIHNPDQVEFKLANGSTLHISVIYLADEEYVLAADVAGFEVSRDYLPNVLVYMVLLSLGCTVIVAFLAITKARRITSPLKQLTTEVSSQQSIHALPISTSYPDNEIGYLAAQSKQAFERLNAALSREKHFTKDISHEIRTPIAVIKNSLSLLHAGAKLTSQELQLLKNATHQLEQTTNTLLALARDESSNRTQVNLTELVEDCLLSNFEVNQTEKGQAMQFQLDVKEDIWQLANPHLLEMMINNALSNIVFYASGSNVTIAITTEALTFTNPIDGHEKESITKTLLESGVRGTQSTGIGQGLSLITRIAQQFDWHTEVNSNNAQFHLIIRF